MRSSNLTEAGSTSPGVFARTSCAQATIRKRAAILPVLGCVLCVVLGQCGAVWHTWNSKNMVPFTMGTLVIASASIACNG